MKTIWLSNEISISDELRQLIPDLKRDFLNYHTDYFTTFSKSQSYKNSTFNTNNVMSTKDAWRTEGIRYSLPDHKILIDLFTYPLINNKFPTASSLVRKYYNHCNCASYNSLEPNSHILRHSDIENRERKFIRIHVPLIIPEGDTFFEVADEEVKWDDIFGFDNASFHSAYNNTNQRRLIFLIDLSREFLGISPEIPFDKNLTKTMPKFIRKQN